MITQNEVFQGVYDALAPIFTFAGQDGPNIWENKATAPLPESGGHILPGVIIQMRHAVPVADDSLDDVQVVDARVHRLQTRIFAATEPILRDAVDHTTNALVGLRVGDYSLRMTTEDEPAYEMLRDPDLDRPYTYVHWRLVG